MKITILGSGNAAHAFARAISNTPGLTLQQICARDPRRGKELASSFGASYAGSAEDAAEAELYIVAVSDSAVGEVSGRLRVNPAAAVVHASGGLSIDAVKSPTPHKGVLYPLQTFSCGRDVEMKDTPLFIEYTSPTAHRIIMQAASSLSDNVREADSASRNRLHAAAVVAGNFSNHLYSLAARILKDGGTDLSVLAPLILETARKAIDSGDPASVQTGPAARHDEVTLERHLRLLERLHDTNITEIYKLMSKSIWETSKKI